MSRCEDYNTAHAVGNPKNSFANSQEAAFRRDLRNAIRRGPFTKSERKVILALVNHWFQHRKKGDGVIHPGRAVLARKAGVAIITVARTLDMLRDYRVIVDVGHLHGGRGKATEYLVSDGNLMALCDGKIETIKRIKKRIKKHAKSGTEQGGKNRIKCYTVSNSENIIPFLAKGNDVSEQGGAA